MERSIIAMLARTAAGAMLADEHGNVVLWNKAAEHLLGFLAQDVIGRPFLLGGCEHRPGAREEA